MKISGWGAAISLAVAWISFANEVTSIGVIAISAAAVFLVSGVARQSEAKKEVEDFQEDLDQSNLHQIRYYAAMKQAELAFRRRDLLSVMRHVTDASNFIVEGSEIPFEELRRLTTVIALLVSLGQDDQTIQRTIETGKERLRQAAPERDRRQDNAMLDSIASLSIEEAGTRLRPLMTA